MAEQRLIHLCSHHFVTLWLQRFSIVLIVERIKIFKARGSALARSWFRVADSKSVEHYFAIQRNIPKNFKDICDNFWGNIKFIQADICFLYRIFNLEQRPGIYDRFCQALVYNSWREFREHYLVLQ